MNTLIFHGVIEKGKVRLDNPSNYLVHLSSLEGKRIELSLQKERNNRTLNQNAYYWGVVIPILAEHHGYEPDEMHTALKYKFLKKHEDTDLVTTGSTKKLSTVEFGEYLDRIIRWAAQEGIVIPDAGDFN